jgi:hypothetical protein
MSKLFTTVVGVFIGIYICQNYDVPNMKYYCDKSYEYFVDLEKQNRKK